MTLFLGRGSGSLIGGLLMGKLGARDTFRYMGIAAAVSGVVYLAVEKIFFRKPIETEKNEKTNSNDTSTVFF